MIEGRNKDRQKIEVECSEEYEEETEGEERTKGGKGNAKKESNIERWEEEMKERSMEKWKK
jgi:hypothetical protein